MIRRTLRRAFTGAAAAALTLAAARPVLAQRIAEIQIAPPYLRMVPDAQAQLAATAYDTAGMPVNVRFRWSSSNINVAVVSDNGMVRAVAPGATLLSAFVEGERTKVRGQVSVFVSRPGEPPMVFVGPPPMPDPARMDSLREAMRILERLRRDSSLRNAIDCNQPMLNAANPLRTCWEERARPSSFPRVPPPRECGDFPSRVFLLVRVSEAGAATDVLTLGPSNCAAYTQAAVDAARRLTYRPATLGGRPVASWVRFIFAPGAHEP